MNTTIKANEKTVKLARRAIEIQDACNPYPITRFLMEVQEHFRGDADQETQGTDISIQNPVSLTVLNKLNHLARTEQTRSTCFDACLSLADGHDVMWEII